MKIGGDNTFASYYDHIEVTPEQVQNIELPVCIIYFPDLYEGNPIPLEQGIDLSSICREIFLVVNRSAKRVSEARTLLLDDEDLAARLMRKTLSTLKNRSKEEDELATNLFNFLWRFRHRYWSKRSYFWSS